MAKDFSVRPRLLCFTLLCSCRITGESHYIWEDNEKASPVDISLVVYKQTRPVNPHQPGSFAYESERKLHTPRSTQLPHLETKASSSDTADVQPNLQTWLQLLRINVLGSNIPMGRPCRFPRSFVLQRVIELGIKDTFLSTLLRCIGALVDICYQEKRSSSLRRCLILRARR